MTSFTAPLQIIDDTSPTGNPQTDTAGYVHCTKIVNLTAGSSRQIITLPPRALLTGQRAFLTSAAAADVSALNVSWGSSSDATRYGLISVSALGAMRVATVSGAGDFYDAGGTIVLVASAVSTTTFTSGGAKAFVEYIVTE